MKMIDNANHQKVEVMNRKSMSLAMTGFLCATPSFVEGLGRILDLGNTFNTCMIPSTPETEFEEDERALQSDWQAVGLDINNAINQYQKANNHERPSKK